MKKTYTHRLFVNEYNADFVKALSNNKIEGISCTDESTENVLCLVGTMDALDKLSSLMYCDDFAKIKSVFPSFLTQEDLEKDIKAMKEKLTLELGHNLCSLCLKYDGRAVNQWKNETFRDIYEMFLQLQ